MRRLLALILVLTIPLHLLAEEAPIQLGALFSLTGFGAKAGSGELAAARMAVAEINAHGGVLGRPMELQVEDTQSDLKTTVTAYRRLLANEKLCGVVGPNWNEFTQVVAPIARSEGMPTITPSAYQDDFFTDPVFVFSLWPPLSYATEPLARYIASTGIHSLTVLLSENGYYETLYQSIEQQLSKLGVQVSVSRFGGGEQSFRAELQGIKQKGDSEGILALIVAGGSLSSFLKQKRDVKLTLPVFAPNNIPYDSVVQENPHLADGIVFFDYIRLGSPTFWANLRRVVADTDEPSAAHAYDAVYLFRDAIEKSGSTKKVALRDMLLKTSRNGETGPLSFDHLGRRAVVSPNTELFVMVDGSVEKWSARAY